MVPLNSRMLGWIMAARKKPPDERTGRGVAQGQDPQFIAVSKAASQRQGIPIPKPSPNWHPSAQSGSGA